MGKVIFSKSGHLPSLFGNKSVAAIDDIDGDGDMDMFVGGRVVAGAYGLIPESYLLLNNGKGIFSIAAENTAPGLRNIGMVSDASWVDIDRDGWKDLVVVGEWMPITIFQNRKGKLVNATQKFGLRNTTGLWVTVTAADLDRDGYEDLLVGNWGENSKLRASKEYPLQLYVGDVDMNGSIDQVVAMANDRNYYTFLGKEEIEKAIPAVIRKKYLDYKSMAGQTIENIFDGDLSRLKKLSASSLSSMIVKNDKGSLSVSPLPPSVQSAPVFSFITDDFNKDGNIDIISAGNFYGVLPYEGRYDANYGTVLLGMWPSTKTLSNLESGILLDGEIRDINKMRIAGGDSVYVFSRNANTILFYKKFSP